MTGPLDWSLLDGAVPTVLLVTGAAAAAALLIDRNRAWWTWKVPLAVGVTVALTIVAGFVVDKWWKPFPDPLPTEVLLWVGVAILGVALAVARISTLRWRWRIAAIAGALLLVALASNQVNRHFQQYPTLRAALGPWLSESTDFSKASGGKGKLVIAPPGKMLADVWKAPPDLPRTGTVSAVTITPTASRFAARSAWLYLPPAHRADPRPRLPLLVLLPGQPGSPRDWLDAGGLQQILDDYAAAHHGLAPVTLLPDATGSTFGNTLCMDSQLGDSETYLTTDLKNWVAANLQVAPPDQGWSIGGYSFGGTCSAQLAVRAPDLYRTFLDMSGQREPTLGSRGETVQQAFGGDQNAFTRNNPLDILAAKRFPEVAGRFVAGASDSEYTPGLRDVYQACQKAGMDVRWIEVPGGHSWEVWRAGLVQQLPWIAERNGLARS